MKKHDKIFKKRRLEDYNYLIAKEQPLSYVSENIQKIILNLEFANVDNNFKVVQVTSTTQSEGKTTVLSNLAYLLSQRGKKVLVMDLDLRRPKLHHVVKSANQDGVADYLLGEKELNEIINTNSDFNFDFIVAGQKTTAITNALMSEKLVNMIKTLKENYDYVFIDTPPTYVVSDPYYIAKLADGIVYVVGYNIAKKREVKEGINELNKVGTPIIGAIISQVKLAKGQYYYYYG